MRARVCAVCWATNVDVDAVDAVCACICFVCLPRNCSDSGAQLRQFQLSLVQWADQYDVSGNGLTSLLTLTGRVLSAFGVLQDPAAAGAPSRRALPVSMRQWQNRADRLRVNLLKSEELGGGGHFRGLILFAMCPDPFCGKLHKLDPVTNHLPVDAQLRCDRRLFSERTEWPLNCELHGTPRPQWDKFDCVCGHEEPVCGTPLTLCYNSAPGAKETDQPREPAKVLTYRSLAAAIATLLAHEGMQEKCELWRQRANAQLLPPAPAQEPAPMDIDEPADPAARGAAAAIPAAAAAAPGWRHAAAMSDVYDGQMWKDMQHWPPLAEQHRPVPGWWEPEWGHRAGALPGAAAAAAAPAAAAAVHAPAPAGSTYEDSYDGRLLAAPGTIALELFIDWYQKHRQGHHSVGLIWACLLNLPREERYETHNMILVAVLPGPSGTSRQQLQGILQLVRNELIELFKHPLQLNERSHRVYLHMLVGDLQAVRPAMGFVCPSGRHACTMGDANFCRTDSERKSARGEDEDDDENADWAGAGADSGADSDADLPVDADAQPAADSSGRDCRLSQVDPQHQLAHYHADHMVHARIWVNCPNLPKKQALSEEEIARRPPPPPAPPSARKRNSKPKEVFPTMDEWRSSPVAYEAAKADEGRLLEPSEHWKVLARKWLRHRINGKAFSAETIEKSLQPALGPRSRSLRDWTALRDLPYFDSVRASPIDVMHNILLGVCKQIMRVATGHKIIQQAAAPEDRHSGASAAHAAAAAALPRVAGGIAFGKYELHDLQAFMNASIPPRDIGRIRDRLESLDHMKAVEWLNWITMQAVPAVRALVYQRALPAEGGKKLHDVNGAHLRLFSLVQQLVECLCAYTTSERAIARISELLRDVMFTCERTFSSMGARVATPNMHLALHLPAQIRDFGPVQGWWCFPFERLMGVAGKLPSKPGTGSVDVAKRLLSMLHLANAVPTAGNAAAAAAPTSFSFSARRHTMLPAPAAAGFTHAYTRAHAGSALRHLFAFTPDAAGDSAAAKVREWRAGERAAFGCEPLPAVLFNSGSSHRQAGSAPAAAASPVGLLQLVRTRSMLSADFHASVLQQAVAGSRHKSKWPRLRPDQRLPGRGLVPPKQLLKNLLTFYFSRYQQEVVQHYAEEIAAAQQRLISTEALAEAHALVLHPLPPQRVSRTLQAHRKEAMAKHVQSATAPLRLLLAKLQQEQRRLQEPQQQQHVVALLSMLKPESRKGARAGKKSARGHAKRRRLDEVGSSAASAAAAMDSSAPRDLPWSTALAWYQLQLHPMHSDGRIDVFDKLLLCGEEIASDIASSSTGVNSFVYSYTVRAGDGHRRASRSTRYGRVSYYVRHRFGGQEHIFAVMRWYERASHEQLVKLWPGYNTVHSEMHPSFGPSAVRAHEERRDQCADSMQRWPVLCFAYQQMRADDLLPVHRIAGRWMPSLAQPLGAGAATDALLQYACPLRSRMYEV